jgi:hypothetical protein
MKTAEAGIRFPILAFTADKDVWRIETLDFLTTCGPRTLKDDMQARMEIVDAELNRWMVQSVRRTGRAQPFLPWLFGALLTATPQSRIEHELEPLPPTSFEEAQARVCASIEAHPLFWCDSPEHDREEVLLPLIAKIRATQSVADICEALGPDDFRGY